MSYAAYNLDETVSFLERLFPGHWPGYINVEVIYQPVKDGAFKKEASFQLNSPKPLKEADFGQLNLLSANGRNFFFTPAFMDGTEKRKKENVLGWSVLWADTDDCPEEKLVSMLGMCPVPPTGVVISGGGYHIYWVLNNFYDREHHTEQFLAALKKVRRWFNGDSAVCRENQILRLPGSYNHKPWKYQVPLPCLVRNWWPDRVYSLDQISSTKLALFEIKVAEDFKKKYILEGCFIPGEKGEAGKRSLRDYVIMKEMIQQGHNKQDICDVFHNPVFACSEKVIDNVNGEQYFERTYLRALADAGNTGGEGVRDNEHVVIKSIFNKNGLIEETVISNFYIKPVEMLELRDEGDFLLTVEIHCSGLRKRLQCEGRHLTGIKTFMHNASFPGIFWSGNDQDFMIYIGYVRQLLTREQIYEGTRVIGWYRGGIVTADKIIHKQQVRYYNDGHAPRVILKQTKLDFKEFMQNLYSNLQYIAPPHCSMYIWAWFAAALYAPYIRKHFQRQFPLLLLSGEPGSGKTTLAHLFTYYLCGVQTEYSYKITNAALWRTLASSNCFPVRIEEYESSKGRQDIDDYFRYAWTMGTSPLVDVGTGRVHPPQFTAPIVFTSMTGLNDEALRDRVINVRIRKHERPKNSGQALIWFRSLTSGYFARNWMMKESAKEIVKEIKVAHEIASLYDTHNDRQIYCQAVAIGLINYANKKYWDNAYDSSTLLKLANPVNADLEKETPQNLFDALIAYMMRKVAHFDMVKEGNWKIEGHDFIINQAHLYACHGVAVKEMGLPMFITKKWLQELFKDLKSRSIISATSKSVRIGGSIQSCVVIHYDNFPLLKEALLMQHEKDIKAYKEEAEV